MVRLAYLLIIRNYCGMVASLIIVLVASILASGVLFNHQRYLTLLAAAGALFEMWWLVLSLAHRVLFPEMTDSVIFLLGALLFFFAFLPMRREFHLPYRSSKALPRDAVIVAVLLLVLSSAYLIQQANGFVGQEWVAHGFYNGDTTTLISLVQRSLVTPGLLEENPFAANGALEYPTLIHAGLADGITAAGLAGQWLKYLPFLVYAHILITIPLFFLFRDGIKELPQFRQGYRWRWRGILLEAGMVGYVLGVSWEAYVYPQGHFFTTTLFLLLLSLLVSAWSRVGRQKYVWTSFALLTTVLLLLSNAVTGVAAVVVWSVFTLFQHRIYLLSVAALLLLFAVQTPGEGALGLLPHFSYTAAPGMLMLGLPVVLLLAAVLYQLRQQSFIGVATIALASLSLITFLFSSRDIIVDNASRFLYHALLVGWPLGVDGLVRTARVLHARVRQLPRGVLRVSGVMTGGVGALLLLFPVAASLMSIHDHLLFKNKQVTDVPTQEAMAWIRENTDPATLFLANPEEPWNIPLFTGRSLIRAQFWLSPQDELLEVVEHAFAGDVEAQRAALSAANYVFLQEEEVDQWNMPAENLVYDVGGIRIYDLGS